MPQSTPEDVDTTTSTPANEDTITPIELPDNTLEFRALVTKLTHTDDGKVKKLELPKGTDIATKMAIEAEISRRSTQGKHTKIAQELALANKKLEKTAPLARKGVSGGFTSEELAELEELKSTDVEEWRKRYNELEGKIRARGEEEYTKAITVDDTALGNEVFKSDLESFNTALDKPLTQDELDNELPPKYFKAVQEGTLTYEEYLTKAYKILRDVEVTTSRGGVSTKTIASTTTPTSADTYNPLEDDSFTL